MAIATAKRVEVVHQHRRHDKDSGSPEVQIGLLTARIREVSDHLRNHKKDFHSRRGLILMVSRRNRLLRYLARADRDAYLRTIQSLGLRK